MLGGGSWKRRGCAFAADRVGVDVRRPEIAAPAGAAVPSIAFAAKAHHATSGTPSEASRDTTPSGIRSVASSSPRRRRLSPTAKFFAALIAAKKAKENAAHSAWGEREGASASTARSGAGAQSEPPHAHGKRAKARAASDRRRRRRGDAGPRLATPPQEQEVEEAPARFGRVAVRAGPARAAAVPRGRHVPLRQRFPPTTRPEGRELAGYRVLTRQVPPRGAGRDFAGRTGVDGLPCGLPG